VSAAIAAPDRCYGCGAAFTGDDLRNAAKRFDPNGVAHLWHALCDKRRQDEIAERRVETMNRVRDDLARTTEAKKRQRTLF